MTIRRTPHYFMPFFEDGDIYSARADFERFNTIDNQLDRILTLTEGGVIEGWGIIQTIDQANTKAITIRPGIGIVPFTVTKTGDDGLTFQEQHFLGARTNNDIIIPNLASNARNMVYIELNRQLVRFIENNPDSIVDLSKETVTVVVRPKIGTPAGLGPFRTTTSSDIGGNTDSKFNEYPIFHKKIDGGIDPLENKIAVFIDGKAIFSGFTLKGNVVTFEDPLQPENVVTVRVDPIQSIVIGEVITDDTRVIEINNDVKQLARERSGDDLVFEALIKHVHDAFGQSPEKILLTTRTDPISPTTNTKNQTYVFDKPDSDLYGFDFNEGTYRLIILINGFFNTNDVTVTDSGTSITLNFTNPLEGTDEVTVVFVVNDENTQITNKLRLSGNNPSEDIVDFTIEGESITSGQIPDINIPKLSHIGRHREILKPANDPNSSVEYVQRTETFDYQEFFPVGINKSNARNAKYLFLEQKDPSPTQPVIHACGSNGFLYQESETVMFQKPENITGGWSHITLNRDLNEYDAPFSIIPVKNPVNLTQNNWDSLFYVGNRFVTTHDWANSLTDDPLAPSLSEVVNLTNDINPSQHNTTITDLRGSAIFDACGGLSPLNGQRTAFILMDNNVYVYDFIGSQTKFFWINISPSSPWASDNAESLNCLDVNGKTILFTGTQEGGVYCNILASSPLNQTADIGDNIIPQGNLSFGPAGTWQNDSYSYGQGTSLGVNFFDILGTRGNKVGYESADPSYGYEEQLPVGIGDNLIFATANLSEKNPVGSALDNTIILSENLGNTFVGPVNNVNSSFMMLDWFEIASGLDGAVKAVDFANGRLIVLTENKMYFSDEVGDIEELYFKELYAFIDASAPAATYNDFGVINDVVILAAEEAVYRGVWNGGTYTWSQVQNTTHGTSINDIVQPARKITIDKDNDDVYICGKYGIFKSVDSGISFRNTTQIIGLPEDRDSFLTIQKLNLRIIDKDASLNRLFVNERDNPFIYGYGYGYGEGLDYFDVLLADSTGYGFGTTEFEDNFAYAYGYGFGDEIKNVLSAINENDWLYFSDNSGSQFINIPIKILGSGSDLATGLFYVDVEFADAEKLDFDKIFLNQTLSVYRKKEPLTLVDGIPQDRRYETTDILENTPDYHRQSISFDSRIDEDLTVEVASEYIAFEPLDCPISDIADEDVEVSIRGVKEINIDGTSTRVSNVKGTDDNFITLIGSGNIDDIVNITIKETYITDVGEYTHEELEDKLSIEELGHTYEFEGIRTSNFHNLMMSIQHAYPDIKNNTVLSEVESTATNVTENTIEDTSKSYAPAALIGRRILLDSDNKVFDYTIENNEATTITIARKKTYENFTSQTDGLEVSFNFFKGVAARDLEVFLDGSKLGLVTDYTLNTFGGNTIGVILNDAPDQSSSLLVSYVDPEDNFDVRDIISTGEKYKILAADLSPFSKLENNFVAMYQDESTLDVEFSFIENLIVLENTDIGTTTQALFYIYFNPIDMNLYAGTNEGIWKRKSVVSLYGLTGTLINTIDASGTVVVPNDLNGAFVRFDENTGEWTVTWGLGINTKDINDNIDDIKVNAVAYSPLTSDIVLAGSENAIYRTMDGGTNWDIVFDLTLDDRTKDFPIVKQIVFDDKNPWIVNAVTQNGLYRSFDYGNNWEKIAEYDIANRSFDASGSFTYQIDSSDARGTFYYGENTIQYKNNKTISPFGDERPKLDKAASGDNNSILIGRSLNDLRIKAIANRPDDVDELFIASDAYGIFRSNMFGNDPHIARGQWRQTFAFTNQELINELSNPTNTPNTGAWHFLPNPDNDFLPDGEPDRIVGRYSIFVDNVRGLTYAVVAIKEGKRNPEPAEFVGKIIVLGSKAYKIIGHYNRGKLPTSPRNLDQRDDDYPSILVELVLDGKYPFLYNTAQLPVITDGDGVVRNKNENDYEYYWYSSDSPFSILSQGFNLTLGFRMPFFQEYNGRIDSAIIEDGRLLDINGTGVQTVAFKNTDSIFPTNTDEVLIRLNYEKLPDDDGVPTGTEPPADFLVDDALKDFLIGDIQATTRYKIYNSKNMTLTAEESDLFHASIALRVEILDDTDGTGRYDPDATVFADNELDSPIRLWNFNGSNRDDTGSMRQSVLFNSGIIDELDVSQPNRIKLLVGRIPVDSLKGYRLFPRSGSSKSFKITSNTANEIFVDSDELVNVASLNDTIRIDKRILSKITNDFIIDSSDNDIMYAAAFEGPYKTDDGGESWRFINDGLPFNSALGEVVVPFIRLKLHNSILYACAQSDNVGENGGVYSYDGIEWTHIGDTDNLGLASVNDIAVFDESGSPVVYAATNGDGVYKGTESGGSWTWVRQIFPEHKVREIELVKDADGELERVWIGTDGKGIFRKDGINDTTWSRDLANGLFGDVEIKSSLWRPWDIFVKDGEIATKAMTADTRLIPATTPFVASDYIQTCYSMSDPENLTDPTIFEWDITGTIVNDDKEYAHLLSIDQSNATHIIENIEKFITDEDAPESHRLSNYISLVRGTQKDSLFGSFFQGRVIAPVSVYGNNLGVEKVEIDQRQSSVYEEPFSHLPDRKSITVIEEDLFGRVFVGTDRSGVWRTKSTNGKKYILPFDSSPSSSYELNNFGYDFDTTKFSRFKPTSPEVVASIKDYYPNDTVESFLSGSDPTGDLGHVDRGRVFDGSGINPNTVKFEKIYRYEAEEGTSLFNDIQSLSSPEDIIGGYFMFADTIYESQGVFGDRFVLEITDVLFDTTTSVQDKYIIYMTFGSRKDETLLGGFSESGWNELDAFDDQEQTGTYNKLCILDFDKYEDITGNLPRLDVKDSNNKGEAAVFVRDMEVVGSQAVIAAGIGGVYLSSNINSSDPDNVDWFNLSLPSGVSDVTTVVAVSNPDTPVYGYGYGYGEGGDYFDVLGAPGSYEGYGFYGFETTYAYEYGYGIGTEFGIDIYIGTWDGGVWSYTGGTWIGNTFAGGTWTEIDPSGLEHKKIWKIFISSDNVLYAGTEHGGIYQYDIDLGGSWSRQLENVVRSRLFMWKTEGVPPRQADGSIDITNEDNLLSYSFGGGVMRSLDRGITWEQVNEGLENFYIQDISICADAATDTAYAATLGGGVFKTTDAFGGDCTWTRVSTDSLPVTLNIDEVEIGPDPDIVYVKARYNDFSFKDLPFDTRSITGFGNLLNFQDETPKGGSLFSNGKYKPLQPYSNGEKKAAIFRSIDGGDSWTLIFDKDPDLEDQGYSFTSSIYGMELQPGSNDTLHFLYKLSLRSDNTQIGNTDQFLFVTINTDQVQSEIPFPFDSYAELNLSNPKSDGSITIDPNNVNEIYVSLLGIVGSQKIPPIYKSIDGGLNWEYATSHLTSSAGFNNKIRIGTKTPSSVTASLSADSSSIALVGEVFDITDNTALFKEAEDFLADNIGLFITASFTQDTSVDPYGDSLFFTYRDEPTLVDPDKAIVAAPNRYPRPFYLNGASLQPNATQNKTLTVADGGHGTFMPKFTKGISATSFPQLTTLVVDEAFSPLDLGETCRLSNLTSLRFDYDSTPTKSILRKENSLIGNNATVSGTSLPIAIHRVIYDSDLVTPSEIEIVVIGNYGAIITSGTSVTISLQEPIYSNHDNDLLVSVNKGLSWKKIGKEAFTISNDNIKGMVNNPDLPSTSPETVRSTYILRDEGEESIVYRGDARDTRYINGTLENLIWTRIGIGSEFSSAKTLQNGLTYSSTQDYLYISEVDKITRMTPTGTREVLFENLNIIHPVTISEADQDRMAFVAGNTIYTTENGFDNFDIRVLPVSITPESITKLVLSRNASFLDEIFLCVDAGQIFDQAAASVAEIVSDGDSNTVNINVAIAGTNPFTGFNLRYLSFEENGSTLIYNTQIVGTTRAAILAANTITGKVSSFNYNDISGNSTIRCEGPINGINAYEGNSIAFPLQSVEGTAIYVGRIESVSNITTTTFDIVVFDDLRSVFSNNNIDFNTRFPFYRIGRLTDYIPTGFRGITRASIASNQTVANGLWLSSAFGEGFSQVSGLFIGGIDDYPGCTNVHVFDDGAIVPVMTKNNINRIMVNDKWISSREVNKVLGTSDGGAIAATSNGLMIISGEADNISFLNVYFDNYTNILDLGSNQFQLFSEDGSTYFLSGIPEQFFGNETPKSANVTVGNVNKAIVDSLGAVWIATEEDGLFALFNNETIVFNSVNSNIGGDTIRDVIQDSRGNIWACIGEGGVSRANYGIELDNIPAIDWTNFETAIGDLSADGLSGSVDSIGERVTLTAFADGTITTPTVTLQWANNSSVFTQNLILRSLSAIVPSVENGTSYVFSPIIDTISSIVESQDSEGNPLWIITGQTNIDYGTNNITGKYIIPDSRGSNSNFEILSNSLNTFTISKTSDTPPTEAGKQFMVAEKVDEAFVVFTGDGNDANYTLEDSELVNDQTYTYYLFSYNPNDFTHILIDLKTLLLSSSSISSETDIDIVVGTSDGLFQFTPNEDTIFEFRLSLGAENGITNIFFDSSNLGWLSAGNKVAQFSAPNITVEFTEENLFGEKSDDIEDGLIVNNVTERLNSDIVIGTNRGLVIRSGEEFFSFIRDDSANIHRDDNGNLVTNQWRPTYLLPENISNTNFLRKNESRGAFFTHLIDILSSDDNGLLWEKVNNEDENQLIDDIEFADVSLDSESNIIDNVFVSDKALASTLSENTDATFNENLPLRTNTTQTSTAGNMWLSESGTASDVLFVGVFNNNVIEDEKEMARLVMIGPDEFDSLNSDSLGGDFFFTGRDGLSIQSTYDFTELISGNDKIICAGCKDSVITRKTVDSGISTTTVTHPWTIFESGLVEKEIYAYTSLDSRVDSESIEHGQTVYATRSSIYGTYVLPELLSLGIDTTIDDKVFRYDLGTSLAGYPRIQFIGSPVFAFQGLFGFRMITKTDRIAFDNYSPQWIQRNTFKGHRGAVKFLSGNRTLAVGGFANTLMTIPFTTELSDGNRKLSSGLASGLRGHLKESLLQIGYPQETNGTGSLYEGFDFPIETNEDPNNRGRSFSFSLGEGNKTEANFRTKYKNAWSVRFDDERGYSSHLHYGQNSDSRNKKFIYSGEENSAYLMKSNDNGGFWMPVGFDSTYPTGYASDYIFDPADPLKIAISTAAGILEGSDVNVGVYYSEDGGSSWVDKTTSLAQVPVRTLELFDSVVYAGLSGFGIFSTDLADLEATPDWTQFAPRFTQTFGLNLGLWEVNSIDEDPINTARVLMGTQGQGILQSLDSGVTWFFDIDGIPTGNVNVIKILPANPQLVLAALENDGLYIRNSQTGIYSKNSTGLPTNSNIIDIQVDTSYSETFTEFNHDNSGGDEIVILRSDFVYPKQAPEDNVVYNVGNELENSKIVYIGTDDFSTTKFRDNGANIRSGIPYLYRFYTFNSITTTYTERSTITGRSTRVEKLALIDESDERLANPFPDLTGRILIPSSTSANPSAFEIVSNTGTRLNLKADPFKILNNGDATEGGVILRNRPYLVQSTVIVDTTTINPIYAVAEDLDNVPESKVYSSSDNGRTWIERNDGIPDSSPVNSITIESLNDQKAKIIQDATLYASTDEGVYKSEDNAVSWLEISSSTGPNNLPSSQEYLKLAVDLENCENLYAITPDGKIYRTLNNGASWELIRDESKTFNVADIVSFFTNNIFLGTEGFGILRVDDSLRDKVNVNIIADGNITAFDVDFLEIGDIFDTDTNSITVQTLVRNDSITDNREQIRFIVSPDTTNIQFSFRKNDEFFDESIIYVGDQLANPPENPFFLRAPTTDNDPTVINEITNIGSLLYAATNRGVFVSDNSGDKWQKINNPVLPDEILDVESVRNGEIILATRSGLWLSSNNQSSFSVIESSGNNVNTVFDSTNENIRTLFRGGDSGLKVTIENSRSLVVFSGDLSEGDILKLDWGDIFNETDGGWSENTIRTISIPKYRATSPLSNELERFEGWDYALIVRKGPFLNFEDAQRAGENFNVFSPDNQVVYPSQMINIFQYSDATSGLVTPPIFEVTGDEAKRQAEEFLEVNLAGDNAQGVSFNPRRFFGDGSIIVGQIPNRKKANANFPGDFDSGPSTDFPVFDKVQPLGAASGEERTNMPPENFVDANAYEEGQARIPSILPNRYYLYKVYPYLLLPDPLTIPDSNLQFATLPEYNPVVGDTPDAYSYIFDIEKFRGATSILTGITIGENNWVIGTDAGIFYSTEAGRDVNTPEDEDIIGLNFTVPALIFTSAGIVIASVISNEIVYLAKSVDIPLGSNWEIINETINLFAAANVNSIFNITEDDQGFIYISTNAGLFRMDSDGNNLILFGDIGDLEALNDGKIIGQEFEIT